jgi:hypothetical protein
MRKGSQGRAAGGGKEGVWGEGKARPRRVRHIYAGVLVYSQVLPFARLLVNLPQLFFAEYYFR